MLDCYIVTKDIVTIPLTLSIEIAIYIMVTLTNNEELNYRVTEVFSRVHREIYS